MNDSETLNKVVISLVQFLLLLIIFHILKISSYAGKFMVEYETAVSFLVIAIVLIFQILLIIKLAKYSCCMGPRRRV